ncbi:MULTISPECIES: NusG domain II-containing protein [Gulbenkiania]|uniref:Uncharacterized protein n=2 Tax=Gulbenkiania TaxID=397456 RepID=A0A0K6H225_9NEIS|nr:MULTISPECIES: NusG domain II-containing protein [Gulbenkiania]TCW33618.1 hypothetical protein EV669_101139 [Gulbenkiania mobilis]CUA85032.1 Uncharacterized protein Ga0061063_2245 [Gulbenkiania indica]
MSRPLLRPGDGLIILLATGLTLWLSIALWQGGSARTVRILSGGRLFLETSLLHDRTVTVPGPLGSTRVEIRAGRVRVASDPGPRQYCVRQGWLTRAGDTALCLPNAVRVELGGSAAYDSLSF